MNRKLSQFIEFTRWVAAIMVIVGHTRQWLMVDYNKLLHKTFLWKLFYIVTGASHEAVVVFFVISGYLIGGISILRARTKGFDATLYFIHRFSRIYTVLIPALVLGLILDNVGKLMVPGIYQSQPGRVPAALSQVPAMGLNVSTFVGNLGMLQTILVPPLGTNGPLWTLACEWWYYILFGSAMTAVVVSGWRRLLSLLVFVGLIWFLPKNILELGVLWLLGVAAALFAARAKFRLPVILASAIFLASLVASRLDKSWGKGDASAIWADISVALGYCLLAYSLSRAREGDLFPKKMEAFNRNMAAFSYSTYLVHYPVLVFAIALMSHFGMQYLSQPSWLIALSVLALCCMLLLIAFGFSRVTEQKTSQVRNWLEHLFRIPDKKN